MYINGSNNENNKILESIIQKKQPVCKRFEQLVKGVYDKFTVSELHFVVFIKTI